MEQPLTQKSSPPNETPTNTTTTTNNNSTKMKPPPLPTPEEVLAHYESQGLDSRAASLKAISDLQTLLLRSSARANKQRLLVQKIDLANARLGIFEMKLDSKPCLPESLAIGVATGAIVHSIAPAIPHLASIWDSVKSATKTFR